MTKKTWLVIAAVVGGLVLFCCLGTGALMLLGVVSQDSVTGARSGGGSAPAGLVGSWVRGTASAISYQNVATGEFAPPSGSGELYDFKDDGTCSHSAMIQTSAGGCTSWIFVSDECSFERDGAALTVELHDGEVRTRTCGGAVRVGEGRARTLHFKTQLLDENGRRTLVLVDDSGTESRFQTEG